MDAQPTQETTLREAFAPFANGRTVYLPVDREARKYRPISGDEFMLMYSDDDGHWLKHSGTLFIAYGPGHARRRRAWERQSTRTIRWSVDAGLDVTVTAKVDVLNSLQQVRR